MPSKIITTAALLTTLTLASFSCTDTHATPKPTFTPAPISSPVPTNTPTPTTASAPTATPTSDAETCDLTNTPYDTLALASAPDEEWRWESRDSGPDSHEIITITASDGTLIGKAEAITKDGMRYSREPPRDNPETYGEWRVVGTDLHGSFPPPCLDPDTFDASDSGPSDEPHFTSERFLSKEEGTMRNEYWADASGRPTRSRRTIFPPEYDGETNTETGVIEFTYSGYGEPNVIEAPCASAAPEQAANPALMRDCIYLLELMDTLTGTATLNWNLDTPLKSWHGVQVQGSPARVTQLILESRGLSGTLPWELVWLDGLEHLWLADNQLTGEIPDDLGRRLASLRTLTLSANQLTGEIPTELTNLANLSDLQLGNNQLSGTIPEELGDLTNLRGLRLNHNRLTGAIPSDLTDLNNLATLYLNGNQFTGCIPPALRDVDRNDLNFIDLQDCAAP